MTANTYRHYSEQFRENAAGIGLRYTLSRTFSAIPAAIGHVLDKLFFVNEIFLKDNKSHFNGPFGFLLGFIPFALGFILGEVIQQLINVPMYIGYYLIDIPISYLISLSNGYGFHNNPNKFHKKMLETLVFGLYVAATQPPPHQMQGIFGFILGVIPQSLRFLANLLGEVYTCIPQFFSDKACEGIEFIYTKIGSAIRKNNKPPSENTAAPQANEPNEPPAKKSKYKRPSTIEDDPTLAAVESEKVDLFKILDINIEDFNKDPKCADKAYKKLAPKCHPDKHPEKAEQFKAISRAADILRDADKSKKYLAWYQRNQATFFASDTGNNSAPINNIPQADPNTKPRRYKRFGKQ